MNDNADKRSGARSIWSVLGIKARRAVDQARDALTAARRDRERLDDSRQRITTMLDEYTSLHSAAETRAHAISDNLNYRLFISQIRQIGDRLDDDIRQADQRCALALAQLQTAEREVIKLDKLEERDARAQAVSLDRREQRRLDDWSIMRAPGQRNG